MPYKTPKIPLFPELKGIEKRVQDLQQNIAELDWLEYSFGLAKTVDLGVEEEDLAPVVYTGVRSDPLDMRPWPDDVYRSYAFWLLTDPSEFLYFDNVGSLNRYPKVQQPVALVVCLDNEKISPGQDRNITHSLCREELVNKLNNKNMSNGIFQIASMLQNTPAVFADYEVKELREPHSWLRLEGLITFRHECT